MVTNNKVLTVSYGTFSCTLEGFDDSFDTMKAIAEYFRDLAADDRYFGAEPPTPDAEMLTRIAEREVERRVQARHEDGAIVLSAAAPAMPETPADEKAEAPVQEAPAESETTQEDTAPETLQAEAPEPDVLAEETAPIAAEVSVEPTALNEMEVVEPVDALVGQAIADAAEETLVSEDTIDMSAAPVVETTEAEMQIVEPEEDDIAENLFEDTFDEEASEDEDLSFDAPEEEEEDSIAAKLRRIRAVVSRSESEADEDDFMEDQHADMDAAVPAMEFDTPEEPAIEDALNEITTSAEPAEVPRARVIRMKRAEFDEAVASGALEEDLAEEADAAPASSLSQDDEAELMAELADLDAELDHSDAPVSEPVSEPVAEEPSPIPADAEPVEGVRPRRARRAQLEEQPPQEAAVDRLIEEANTKLDEPEGNRRRNAIAHLRAAVAATKAEKSAGKSLVKDDQEDVYRDDLASAMRPKREETGEAAKSAAPLKLVAAQRIDAQEEIAPKRGIRPRRVSPEDLAAVEANAQSSDFVEFAENMGATQLPDVLEAAASYLTFVEGRRKFSRPMLMRLAYQVGDKRFEREAGLRSFGQLLREKKIEKIAGGRFTVSDSISFKPNDRAAG